MDLFLGIDLGASSLKASLLDTHGRLVDTARIALRTDHPAAGHSEQDPAAWRGAMLAACHELAARQNGQSENRLTNVQAMSFSGGAHIAVFCDADARPLRPAILWSDQRADEQAAHLRMSTQVEAISGNRPNATWTLPQMLWLAEHEPHIIATTKKLFFAKDWLRYQLTEHHTCDATEAAGGMLADKAGLWSPDLQSLSGLDAAAFAPLLDAQAVAGHVSAAAAAEFGLPVGLTVYQGAIDTSMEWLCLGPPKADAASLKLASAGVLSISTPTPTPQPPISLYPHVAPQLFYYAAGMSDCMGAIAWVRENLTPELSAAEFAQAAERAPLGAEGLLFYPYLSGARAPFWDSALRAELYGLTRGHGASAIARAAFEGVGYVLTAIWHDMTTRLGRTPDHLQLLGGGAEIGFFAQMLADMLNTPLQTGAQTDCSVATAWLAGCAHGAFDMQKDDLAHQAPVQQFVPDKQAHRGYAERHDKFMARHRA